MGLLIVTLAEFKERDSAGWNLGPEEVRRRRSLFWELFVYDAWTVRSILHVNVMNCA